MDLGVAVDEEVVAACLEPRGREKWVVGAEEAIGGRLRNETRGMGVMVWFGGW